MPDRKFSYVRQFIPREKREKILIVCEGETEKLYLEKFSRKLYLINVKGGSALALVKRAVEEKNDPSKYYNKVWCVVDRDKGGNHNIKIVEEAWKLATENQIQLAYSNQCFELWFLLHYEIPKTKHTRPQYREKLSEFIGKRYKKAAEEMHGLLKKLKPNALQNAAMLYDRYPEEDWLKNDPYTRVHLLVEEIEEYLKGY